MLATEERGIIFASKTTPARAKPAPSRSKSRDGGLCSHTHDRVPRLEHCDLGDMTLDVEASVVGPTNDFVIDY